MGKFIIQGDDNKYEVVNNIITNEGRDSLTNALLTDSAPGWGYIAVGSGTSTPTVNDTELGIELCRRATTGVHSPSAGIARYLCVFTPREGNGLWREIAIFDSPEIREYLSQCDTITGWTSDGTLTSEPTIVQQSAASIKCTMAGGTSGDIAYETSALTDPIPELESILQTDFFQFWYRTNVDTGTLTVRLGVDSSNYYQWTWTPGVTDEWAHFHNTFDNASVTGTPTGAPLTYFRLSRTDPSNSIEYLDGLSIFRENGTMMARGAVDATKVYNTVRNVYYSIRLVIVT